MTEGIHSLTAAANEFSGHPLPQNSPPPSPRPRRVIHPGPIYTLPPELLGSILSDVLATLENKPRRRRKARVTLRLVCRLFKEIVDCWLNTLVISSRYDIELYAALLDRKALPPIRKLVMYTLLIALNEDECLKVIRLCSSISELKVGDFGELPAVWEVIGPSIRHLEVENIPSYTPRGERSYPRPPKRLKVSTVTVNRMDFEGIRELNYYLVASHESLISLTIRHHQISNTTEFGYFLQQFPNLRKLHLGPFSLSELKCKPVWTVIANIDTLRTLIISTTAVSSLFGLPKLLLPPLETLILSLKRRSYKMETLNPLMGSLALSEFRFNPSPEVLPFLADFNSTAKLLPPGSEADGGGIKTILRILESEEDPYDYRDIFLGRTPTTTAT